jgi:hypothetical protein
MNKQDKAMCMTPGLNHNIYVVCLQMAAQQTKEQKQQALRDSLAALDDGEKVSSFVRWHAVG